MRFETLSIKGFGPFKKQVELDLSALPGTIVAVTGDNGAGKSTLLELLAASLYREAPTRGRLAALANERNAVLQATVVNGARHTLRHLVDNVSEKGEALVLDKHGAAVSASAKLTEFKAWASEHLPPPELFYSSMFAAQGSAGFLQLKPSERKAVLLRALGIERLEALAQAAREQAREAKAQLMVAAARQNDTECRLQTAEDGAAPLDRAREQLQAAEHAANEAEQRLRMVLDECAQVEVLTRAAEQAAARKRELEQRIAKLEAQLEDRRVRLQNNRALLSRSDEVRSARARAEQLDAQLEAQQTQRLALECEVAEAEAERARCGSLGDELKRRIEQAQRQLQAWATSLYSADEARAQAAQRPALQSQCEDAERAYAEAQARREALAAQQALGAEQRITRLRAGLSQVAEMPTKSAKALQQAAGATLRQDDEDALAHRPEALSELGALMEQRRVVLSKLAADLQRAREAELRMGELARIEASAEQLTEHIKAWSDEHEQIVKDYQAAFARQARAHDACAALHERQRAAREERRAAARDAMRLEALQHAQERIDELNVECTQLQHELSTLREELSLHKQPEVPQMPDVSAAQSARDAAHTERQKRVRELALAEEREAQLHALRGELKAARAARSLAELELGEWSRLAEDLGRDGLQALEIDAAGPELSAMVNDLLRSCVGPRWTVTIETQRTSADGKRTLEGCEVRVLDSEAGREGAVESFSGGERVLIGEAVSLALSSLACRRSGVQGPTLVRDETGAALDEERAAAYVAMLRRAAQIVGASKVLFVSHNPATWELADARLHVAHGEITVN